MAEHGKDFIINESGEIVSLNGDLAMTKTPEDKLEAEYNQLVYDMSHPERFTNAQMAGMAARRAELEKTLGKDKFITVNKEGKFMDAAARMRAKQREKIAQQNAIAAARAKEND